MFATEKQNRESRRMPIEHTPAVHTWCSLTDVGQPFYFCSCLARRRWRHGAIARHRQADVGPLSVRMGDERRGANRSSMSPASFAMRWSARSSLNTRIDAHQGAASLQCDLVLTRRAMLFSPLIESKQGRNRNEQNNPPDRRCRRPCLHGRCRQRAGRACFGRYPRQARQCHTGHGFGRAGVLAPPLALPSPPPLAPLVVVSAARRGQPPSSPCRPRSLRGRASPAAPCLSLG